MLMHLTSFQGDVERTEMTCSCLMSLEHLIELTWPPGASNPYCYRLGSLVGTNTLDYMAFYSFIAWLGVDEFGWRDERCI